MSDIEWIEPRYRARAESTAEFLRATSPLARVRELAEAGGRLDKEHVRRAAAEGVLLPLRTDPSMGQACAVAEQWGRALAPAPMIELSVVADTLQRSGSAHVFEEIAAGNRIATWASSSLPGYWGSGDRVITQFGRENFTLTGKASLVVQAADCDAILIAACDGDGLSQFLVPIASAGLDVERLDSLDLTRARYELTFNDVVVEPSALVGERGAAAPELARQTQLAVVLSVASTIGSMGALFDLALGYAKRRVAFGRPIGSFQAVKHLLVDASLGLEMSRAMCDAAAEAIDGARDDAPEVVSMAKAFVATAGVELAHTCWQVFGGIAYQWQHDFHLYLRRITCDAALFGTANWHNERICTLHSLGVSA